MNHCLTCNILFVKGYSITNAIRYIWVYQHIILLYIFDNKLYIIISYDVSLMTYKAEKYLNLRKYDYINMFSSYSYLL